MRRDAARPAYSLPAPPSWQEVFGNAHPVEVEVGPGKGSFLLAAAKRTPEHNFFGIEFSRRRLHRIAQFIARDRPGNVRAIAADVGCVLHTLIRPDSVTAFHVYFPDPWWKRRHHRRRIFRDDFAAGLARALVPDGRILIATDVPAQFARILDQLDAVPSLERFPWQRDQRDRNGKPILTDFERQFLDAGTPVYYAGFRKAGGKKEGAASGTKNPRGVDSEPGLSTGVRRPVL